MLITGAARGIGAATARRLHARGARVALAGLEPDALEAVAADCGGAPWWRCDVADRAQVDRTVAAAVERLGGLDVVIANAGVAAQLPLVGGDPAIFERTLAVNTLGVYFTLRAAGPHIAHARGYALAVASLAAAVHLPLLGAYSASKAAVEALGDTLRIELHSSGARVGVAYFAALDTDMTRQGFGTRAAARLRGRAARGAAVGRRRRDRARGGPALAAGRRARAGSGRCCPLRMLVQRGVDVVARRQLDAALAIAREEEAPLTTPQSPAAAQDPARAPRAGSRGDDRHARRRGRGRPGGRWARARASPRPRRRGPAPGPPSWRRGASTPACSS